MKLKKAAALVLASLLAAGTVCLTACGADPALTAQTQEDLAGLWISEDCEDVYWIYAEPEKGLSVERMREIEREILALPNVSSCTLYTREEQRAQDLEKVDEDWYEDYYEIKLVNKAEFKETAEQVRKIDGVAVWDANPWGYYVFKEDGTVILCDSYWDGYVDESGKRYTREEVEEGIGDKDFTFGEYIEQYDEVHGSYTVDGTVIKTDLLYQDGLRDIKLELQADGTLLETGTTNHTVTGERVFYSTVYKKYDEPKNYFN